MSKQRSVAYTHIICVIPAHYYMYYFLLSHRISVVHLLSSWLYIYYIIYMYLHTIVLRLFLYYALSSYRFRQTYFLIYVSRSHSIYTSDLSSCKELRHAPHNCIGVRCGIQTATHSNGDTF